jgi:hypothetical protein
MLFPEGARCSCLSFQALRQFLSDAAGLRDCRREYPIVALHKLIMM